VWEGRGVLLTLLLLLLIHGAGSNSVSFNTVDTLTVCPAGSHSSTGSYACSLCAPGSFNHAVGQSSCGCCSPGTFANVSGLSQCFSCTDTAACQQPCTVIPNCDCTDPLQCDTNRCPLGCYTPNGSSVCQRAPVGSYTACDSSNCSTSANVLDRCPRGTFSPSIGAFSNRTCKACPAGSFCPDAGEGNPQPCPAGTFSRAIASAACTPCTAGTYSAVSGSSSCEICPAGMYCPTGALQQCRCPINSYAPPPGGAGACTPCLGQAVPTTGQSECVTEVAVTGSQRTLYKCIIGIFAAISLGSVCLVVILVRSRHAFSVRPFHSGICIYIASFAPYALLKAVAVGRLLEAKTQGEQLTAGLMLNSTFMMFFWLGFGGKMALIQLWMHLISRHTSSDSEHALMESARRTWRFMRLTVLLVCVLYGAGFLSLVGVYAQASSGCAAAADSTGCIPLTSSATPPACQEVVSMAQGIVYYEGVFAAVVVVVFTFYAIVFNGLVYAMLTSDATFSNLTKLQRLLISNSLLRCMLRPYARACVNLLVLSLCRDTRLKYCLTQCIRFIPPSWRPSPFKTSGDVELWRTSLRALGIKLAVISVCSFACKAVLVALRFFGVLPDGSSLDLSMSTLLVEALPSLLTITLLIRYHSSSMGAARGTALGDIGTSLLAQHASARGHTPIHAAAELQQ
jgi:hypothetical protein